MIYSAVIQSKNGEAIPLFADGKPMHSKYNPTAERLLADQSAREGFFLVGGIGGGYHIANLARQLKSYCIIAFEADKESLEYCMKLKSVQDLARNPRIIFCLASQVQALVSEHYLPALYGDFSCLFQRAWQQENETACRTVEDGLSDTLKAVSADFSVQSHFGKIWMHNILVNLRDHMQGAEPGPDPQALKKCAAIIAAGFFGTNRYENSAYRNGYQTWSAFDESGREWKFQRDVSIHGADDEKCERFPSSPQLRAA